MLYHIYEYGLLLPLQQEKYTWLQNQKRRFQAHGTTLSNFGDDDVRVEGAQGKLGSICHSCECTKEPVSALPNHGSMAKTRANTTTECPTGNIQR